MEVYKEIFEPKERQSLLQDYCSNLKDFSIFSSSSQPFDFELAIQCCYHEEPAISIFVYKLNPKSITRVILSFDTLPTLLATFLKAI